MTRANDEPRDGFLDENFASFRDRKRATRSEEPLEPSPRNTTRVTGGATSAIAALIDGLEDTRATPRADPPAAPTPAPIRSIGRADAEPPPADATRSLVREKPSAPAPADDIDGSCSDPEFARFRAQRKPPSGSHRKPTARQKEVTPRSGVHRAPDQVEDRSSDPEFDRFRAERKPASGAHRKTARHTAPLEPAPRSAEVGVPTPDPTSMLASDRGGDPAFARFRSPETPPPVAPPPVDTADASAAGSVPEADDLPVFFGTSTHVRSTVRARVMDERTDDTPPETEAEAAARRRAPPPPLPARPRE